MLRLYLPVFSLSEDCIIKRFDLVLLLREDLRDQAFANDEKVVRILIFSDAAQVLLNLLTKTSVRREGDRCSLKSPEGNDCILQNRKLLRQFLDLFRLTAFHCADFGLNAVPLLTNRLISFVL